MVFWRMCGEIITMSDAQLDQWKARGVGGFVCQTQSLRNLGGAEDFTADPSASLAGSNHQIQRQIRDSHLVARAAARGIKLWLGIYVSNYYNHTVPLVDWFDNAAWTTQVLPVLSNLAGAARTMGFAGVAFDEEQYNGGTWSWSYPGNTHSEADVRAAVRLRGVQMMQAMAGAYPRLSLLDYWSYFPESWNAIVQQNVNGIRTRTPRRSRSTCGTGSPASRATARSPSSTRRSRRLGTSIAPPGTPRSSTTRTC